MFYQAGPMDRYARCVPDPSPDDLQEPTRIEELPFEVALERLEGLIDRVESGEATLEETLNDYTAGTELIRRCRAVLDSAEQRMAELVAGADGSARIEGGAS